MKKRKGFTLIELLMTVLIVSILSAIALPQYTKVVERARATEAMSMVKSINEAVYAYAAARPGENCSGSNFGFHKLVITLPVSESDATTSISLKNFRYDLNQASTIPGTNCKGVTATRINGGDYNYVIWHPYARRQNYQDKASLRCYTTSDEPKIRQKNIALCQGLGLYKAEATPTNGK